jgi:hypothetical protein
MPSTAFAITLAMLTLLGTPILSLLAARRLSQGRPRNQRLVFWLLLGGIALVSLSCYFGTATSVYEVNAIVLAVAYLALGILAFSAFRIRPKILGVLAGLISLLPMVMGVLLATIGILALAFIIGDTVPIHQDFTDRNLKCYVTSFGNATTSYGGYDVTLKRQVPVLSFVEYTVGQHRFTDPEFQPVEACQRARSEKDRNLDVGLAVLPSPKRLPAHMILKTFQFRSSSTPL